MPQHRVYDTQIHDDDSGLTVSLRSIPKSTLDFRAGEGSHASLLQDRSSAHDLIVRQFAGANFDLRSWTSAPTVPDLRDLIARVVPRGVPSPRNDRPLETDLSPFVDVVCASPVVMFESSWPRTDSLSAPLIAAGGVGAAVGLAVAAGTVGPIALVVVPAGMVLVAGARGLAFRAGRMLGPDVRLELGELRDLHRDGLISNDEYTARKQQVLDASYGALGNA